MIFGIGCDIAKVERFKKWIENPGLIERFFSSLEILIDSCSAERKMEHYASRFACKEAFSKALGVSLFSLNLKEICVVKNDEGRPEIHLSGNTKSVFENKCGKNAKVFVSLSHEKEFALAYCIIERG